MVCFSAVDACILTHLHEEWEEIVLTILTYLLEGK